MSRRELECEPKRGFEAEPKALSALSSALKLQELRLMVHLGCSPEERKLEQEVRVSTELRFKTAPFGIASDELGDTINYALIAETYFAVAKRREFNLIENLAGELLLALRDVVKDQAFVAISVHKVMPPIEGLIGGAVFRLGDFP